MCTIVKHDVVGFWPPRLVFETMRRHGFKTVMSWHELQLFQLTYWFQPGSFLLAGSAKATQAPLVIGGSIEPADDN